jgi:hypothetical protein
MSKRCETNEVGYFGECIACNADQGQTCLPILPPMKHQTAVRKRYAYERARRLYRELHPLGPVAVTEKPDERTEYRPRPR